MDYDIWPVESLQRVADVPDVSEIYLRLAAFFIGDHRTVDFDYCQFHIEITFRNCAFSAKLRN